MKFVLKDIEVEIFLGVPEKERANKQKILVSVFFEYDTSSAEISDNITDTVDYFAIYEFVKQFPGEKEFCLLEKFYRSLFEALQKSFLGLRDLKLEIQKFPFEEGRVIVSG